MLRGSKFTNAVMCNAYKGGYTLCEREQTKMGERLNLYNVNEGERTARSPSVRFAGRKVHQRHVMRNADRKC